jgi:putative ABC transport system permease protein
MTLSGLAIRNLTRNRFRSLLTAVAVAATVITFLLLRTVMTAWASGGELAARDRVVTRNKVTFRLPLPRRYFDVVRAAPHVKDATWATWVGAKDPNHPKEFFGTYAVDPATYFAVYDEAQVLPEGLAAWKGDKQGAIVGDMLAKKLGWKVGDRITLDGDVVPGTWSFTIDALYTSEARSIDRSSVIVHWDYLNDTLKGADRDGIGIIVTRVDDPARSAETALALDRMFEDRETPTFSQDERSFNASFLAMFAGILRATDLLSGAILVIMTLVVGNTIAMGVRERTREYGVLRALGFLPWQVSFWVLGESMALGALGGAIGVGLAVPFIDVVVGRFVDENMGMFFRSFQVVPANVAWALAAATLLGGLAAAVPAWRASRITVVDAVRQVA